MMGAIEVDLDGKTAVVTGANTGIGKEIARSLVRFGAKVFLACRTPAKGEAAAEEIRASSSRGEAVVVPLDVSSQKSIRAFAAEMKSRVASLDILVDNAGMYPSERELTVDGIERCWATNQLGYFLVTHELMPLLRAADAARIVVVASDFARGLDLTDVEFARRRFDGNAVYAQTKQANRMWSWALARRLAKTHVTINAMHPGLVASDFGTRRAGIVGFAQKAFFQVAGRSTARGADTAVWLAASHEAAGKSGKYWFDRRERGCQFANDERAQEQLYALSAKMVGVEG